MKDGYGLTVAGATRAVDIDMGKIRNEQNFPLASLKRLTSSRSAGKTLEFRGESLAVEELREDSLRSVDISLASCAETSNWTPAERCST